MNLNSLHVDYITADPFPHIVIDDVLDLRRAEEAYKAYPGPNDIPWFKYENVFERKLAFDKVAEFPCALRDIFYELNSRIFVQWLEILTGIPDLEIDETYRGGGLHCITTGGKLDVHADFNIHPVTKLHRRVNAILFLNKEWEDSWGGELELWNKEMTHCVKKVLPVFNRMVIFNVTDISFHGHPNPLKCPEGMWRKSMAWYYYTKDRPECEKADAHSTIYKKRPQDQTDEETETLRAQRAKGRLADMQVTTEK